MGALPPTPPPTHTLTFQHQPPPSHELLLEEEEWGWKWNGKGWQWEQQLPPAPPPTPLATSTPIAAADSANKEGGAWVWCSAGEDKPWTNNADPGPDAGIQGGKIIKRRLVKCAFCATGFCSQKALAKHQQTVCPEMPGNTLTNRRRNALRKGKLRKSFTNTLTKKCFAQPEFRLTILKCIRFMSCAPCKKLAYLPDGIMSAVYLGGISGVFCPHLERAWSADSGFCFTLVIERCQREKQVSVLSLTQLEAEIGQDGEAWADLSRRALQVLLGIKALNCWICGKYSFFGNEFNRLKSDNFCPHFPNTFVQPQGGEYRGEDGLCYTLLVHAPLTSPTQHTPEPPPPLPTTAAEPSEVTAEPSEVKAEPCVQP